MWSTFLQTGPNDDNVAERLFNVANVGLPTHWMCEKNADANCRNSALRRGLKLYMKPKDLVCHLDTLENVLQRPAKLKT